MTDHTLTNVELANTITRCAGADVRAEQLQADPPASFTELGVDSLGVLGIVAELERSLNIKLGGEAERCDNPRTLQEMVNAKLTVGA